MKKNVVALLLSVVLASGSLGGAPAMAAENVEQQKGEVQEEAEEAASEEGTENPADETGAEETAQKELGSSDVTEAETAEGVDPGETASDASDTAEPKETEESAVVEEENESELSAEETETSDESEIKPETVGDGATQSETVVVEPSKEGIAVKGNAEDESSDLKVAADAEKLKSGKWQEVTKTVHHAEEGHYETVAVKKTVVDEPAWDEPVYETYARCSACGVTFDNDVDIADHVVDAHNNEASWDTVDVQVDTIHHPAKTHKETVYEKQWVVDKAAWDEQVKTGTYRDLSVHRERQTGQEQACCDRKRNLLLRCERDRGDWLERGEREPDVLRQ